MISISSTGVFGWCFGKTTTEPNFIDLKEIFPGLRPDVGNSGYSHIMLSKLLGKIKDKYSWATDEQILTSLVFSKYEDYSTFCKSSYFPFVRKYYEKFDIMRIDNKPVIFKWNDILAGVYIRDTKGRIKKLDTSHLLITMLIHEKEGTNDIARFDAWFWTIFGDNIQSIIYSYKECSKIYKTNSPIWFHCVIKKASDDFLENYKLGTIYPEDDMIGNACGVSFAPTASTTNFGFYSLRGKVTSILKDCKSLVGNDQHLSATLPFGKTFIALRSIIDKLSKNY